MCQKAFGAFYGAACDRPWRSRGRAGRPKHFASSNLARRGFCADCGTPLTYEVSTAAIELAIGAFDDPALVAPVLQVNPADKLPFTDGLAALPVRQGQEQDEADVRDADDHLLSASRPRHGRMASAAIRPTMKERLYLFDTTLRDGAQTPGVDFSLDDKLLVARTLDELGVDYVEGGYPGANPTDTAFFAEKRQLTRATFTAFGMTKRAGRSVSNDPGFADAAQGRGGRGLPRRQELGLSCASGARRQPGGESRSHRATPSRAVREAGREALIDCEHFFDGYKANPAYALACATRGA